MAKNLAKKVSVSLPEDIITFLDALGKNRSKTLVTIIAEYKSKKETKELEKAYEEYSKISDEEQDYIDVAALTDLQEEV